MKNNHSSTNIILIDGCGSESQQRKVILSEDLRLLLGELLHFTFREGICAGDGDPCQTSVGIIRWNIRAQPRLRGMSEKKERHENAKENSESAMIRDGLGGILPPRDACLASGRRTTLLCYVYRGVHGTWWDMRGRMVNEFLD